MADTTGKIQIDFFDTTVPGGSGANPPSFVKGSVALRHGMGVIADTDPKGNPRFWIEEGGFDALSGHLHEALPGIIVRRAEPEQPAM